MQSFCRTCFLQISDTPSSAPLHHESIKCQLIFCIPEMDLRGFSDVKLCEECIAVLNVIYKFKMKCWEEDDQFNKRRFNVTDLSMVTRDSHLDSNICIICRTSLEVIIDNNIHLTGRSFYKSKLMFCIPEMDFQVISAVNLCNNCHIILDKIYVFKIKCLGVEKKLKEYQKLYDKIDFRDLSMRSFVKFEVSSVEDHIIKQEEVDLVNEEELLEDVKYEITNAAPISLKPKKLKSCQCVEKTSECQYCKCNDSVCTDIESSNSKCVYNTVQKYNLHQHIRPHFGGESFKCTLCGYSARKESSLKMHVRIHTGEKPFQCSLCDYSTAQKSNLKKHIRRHTAVKPFKCLLCEYSAAQKSTLNLHIRTHSGEKPFKCPLCEYSAARKSILRCHFFMHTGERPFKCSLCEYSVTQKCVLKNHIYIHSGEKPFKCLLCEYSTSRKSILRVHIQTHTGEKPFKCSFCEYSAAQKVTLNGHIRTHTGERPFECSLCEYRAAQKATLYRHIRTHIDENS